MNKLELFRETPKFLMAKNIYPPWAFSLLFSAEKCSSFFLMDEKKLGRITISRFVSKWPNPPFPTITLLRGDTNAKDLKNDFPIIYLLCNFKVIGGYQ